MPTKIFPEELVDFDSPLAEFFRSLTAPWPFRPLLTVTPVKHFVPNADVFTRNGDLVMKFDLPGVDPKDVHVKLVEDEIVIAGERKAEKEFKEEGYYRKESAYGYFERRMPVPKGIKEADIKAEYFNGVLEISLPRPEKTALPKAKEIPVKLPIKPIKEVKALKK